jgi:hypothetical protein
MGEALWFGSRHTCRRIYPLHPWSASRRSLLRSISLLFGAGPPHPTHGRYHFRPPRARHSRSRSSHRVGAFHVKGGALGVVHGNPPRVHLPPPLAQEPWSLSPFPVSVVTEPPIGVIVVVVGSARAWLPMIPPT